MYNTRSLWSACFRRGGWISIQSDLQSRLGTSLKRLVVKKTHFSSELTSLPCLCSTSSKCYSTQNDKSNENSPEAGKSTTTQKLTSKDRLKIITTQYGAFGMAFHITISLASLGFFYSLVYMGVDMASLFNWFGVESSSFTTGASTFMIAYAVHKIFAPVRIGITFVSVPILVKYFRNIGFFKNK
uniref:protein FAM210B, mitochondrial-like n=1 Tax=Styela clava TaxID=7725 RepID=UPI00193A99E9|nr:protein FAM210B, mitochondrial-like [Styela clava]